MRNQNNRAMKLTDLKIGNYIQTPNGIDEIRGLINRNCFKDVFLVKNSDIEIEDVKPIPLTEKWLLKLGFDDSEHKKGYTGLEYRSNVILDFVLTKPLVMGEWQKDYCFELIQHRFVEIKYIHELQNLYHVLKGKDLKIKKLE